MMERRRKGDEMGERRKVGNAGRKIEEMMRKLTFEIMLDGIITDESGWEFEWKMGVIYHLEETQLESV